MEAFSLVLVCFDTRKKKKKQASSDQDTECLPEALLAIVSWNSCRWDFSLFFAGCLITILPKTRTVLVLPFTLKTVLSYFFFYSYPPKKKHKWSITELFDQDFFWRRKAWKQKKKQEKVFHDTLCLALLSKFAWCCEYDTIHSHYKLECDNPRVVRCSEHI